MNQPLVFAHRGSSHALPEHTLPAYLRAIQEGADGLECDVRLTNDGHLVCLHDRRLGRVSNGRGLVSEHTLAELDALDFGVRHPGLSSNDLILDEPDGGRPTRVLTLDRLIGAARDAGRPMRLLVETKHPTRFGPEVEEELVRILHRQGLDKPDPAGLSVTMMSFSFSAVRRVRDAAPHLPVVQLAAVRPAAERRAHRRPERAAAAQPPLARPAAARPGQRGLRLDRQHAARRRPGPGVRGGGHHLRPAPIRAGPAGSVTASHTGSAGTASRRAD